MSILRPWSRRAALVLLASLSCVAAQASAAYPTKPVRMVVGFAPGGPSDLLARIVAEGLSKTLGQQVIIDNKAGAGGALGAREVSKAPADGYTILFAGNALTVLPQLNKSVGYDPSRDFTPIRILMSQQNVLIANRSKGLLDVKTLVTRSRAKPRSVAFASGGSGSPSHLLAALFESTNGIDLVHVPYRSASPAMTDLIGGQLDIMFVGMPVGLQNASRPELAVLAVTGDKRSDALPQVPTFAELGFSGLGSDTANWWAIMGPPGLPADVTTKLQSSIAAAMADPRVRKNLQAQGVELLNEEPATLAKWILRDSQKWGNLIREKNISAE